MTFVAGTLRRHRRQPQPGRDRELTLAAPSAALIDPIRGQIIDVKDLAGRGCVDITFASFDESPSTPRRSATPTPRSPITAGGTTRHRAGRPMLVSGTTYRYFFTGHLTGGLVVTFIDGSWANTGGSPGARSRRPSAAPCTRRPTCRASRPTSPRRPRGPRTWVDVAAHPGARHQVDAASILTGAWATDGEFTFTGGGTPGPDLSPSSGRRDRRSATCPPAP